MIARLLDENGEEIARTVTSVFDDAHPVTFWIAPKKGGRLPAAMEVTVQFKEWIPEVPPESGDMVVVSANAATCSLVDPNG